mmetsp:Transcript_17969/g.36120  ORF Transcript_17969/g.36120 Transcript_17969/m.36120 type:complete len:499 (+) Transcript_17969:130-1626(+)|eukprot:CAMPEP_0171333160 /NCGR_PEP_ID=MMETSP0878-20121228/3846_1 /TAXON_ID=67004 /ORGANISM="Thalassiosira weissflogii, Strain CCMP1336" /LENGTH=498 /DNA_ID=CAMNT_0011834069 /DNA_START=112 /DNA_END=1608 /DNA_ORIENTATION=-
MIMKKTAFLLALASTDVSARSLRKGTVIDKNDITEDVEFWTRMTQAMGSMPAPEPTNKPTTRFTPKPTNKPSTASTNKPTTRITPNPTVNPTEKPTEIPTTSLTERMTDPPTTAATERLTEPPTVPVTEPPIEPPTDSPTEVTTLEPTSSPTPSPTVTLAIPSPTSNPTLSPSFPCNLSPEDRAQAFRNIALTVTDAATLDDPSSAQAQALDWIINEDFVDSPCPEDGPCETVQRYIMAAFYFAADGGNWDQCNAANDLSSPESVAIADSQCNRVVTPFPVNNPRIGDTSTASWLSPVDECEWGGLACWGTDDTRRGCMDQIDFENDGLAGTLISEINNLDQLRFYILEQGNTTGTIPTEYGLFERLLILDMDFNDLTGELPEELFNIGTLQQLDLNDNILTGTLSTAIGQLDSLTFLQIDHNEIEGTIPTEVGLLSLLRIGFFNDNDLTGTMPLEVCALRNNTDPPGFLGTLVVDCNPPENPEVECSCCSSCNVIDA